MFQRSWFVFLAGWVAFLCVAGVAPAQELPPGSLDPGPAEPKPEISVSARSVPAGGTFDVVARFDLDDTVYLYRDKIRFEWDVLRGAKFIELIRPPAKSIADTVGGDATKTVAVYEKEATVRARLVATGRPGDKIVVRGRLAHQSCTDTFCFRAAAEPFAFELSTTAPAPGAGQTTAAASAGEPKAAPPAVGAPEETSVPASLLGQILFAFLLGLGIAFTPCVYPTLPIAAAVIGGRKEKGLASALTASFVYVLGLSLVYAVVGLFVARGGNAVRGFLSSAPVRIPLAGLFVVLAVVMFAGWNFAVPSGYAARLQGRLAGKRGLLPTFALGAVSALVIGPCATAPLAGLLAYVADKATPVVGFWMLLALGWGMGIPLIAFGTATGLMPKAGPWMEWVKKLLGFVLLWAALFFLRPILADTMYEAGLALLLVAGAVFLGGFDVLTSESAFFDRFKKFVGVIAALAGVFFFLSAAGHLPGGGAGPAAVARAEHLFKPGTLKDVEDALAAGRKVIIDFYSDNCYACDRLDANVFTRPEVKDAAKGIVTIKINGEKDPAAADQYRVRGYPTVVFLDPAKTPRETFRFIGERTLADFLGMLEKFQR